MTDYRVFPEAYVKVLLHAAKFPAHSCSGLLIGEESGAVFEIVDAVPLFHHESPLAPLTEVACSLVDAWCQQQKRKIVGFYYANGVGLEPTPSLSYSAEKIADQVETNCSRACVLLVRSSSCCDLWDAILLDSIE
jgi:ER membrane protein complex subunit 8/9